MRVRIISKSKPFYASVILTPSARNCAKKGRFIDHCCGKPLIAGAGEGNRTLVVSLGSFCSTIELHPRGLWTIQRLISRSHYLAQDGLVICRASMPASVGGFAHFVGVLLAGISAAFGFAKQML